MKSYKRYILFVYPDFDPPAPSDCIADSFDLLDDVIEAYTSIEDCYSKSIFDCDARSFIFTFDGTGNFT